jgi:NADH:ubiquinone oxidoreductase subunit 6 (subunit J)
MVGFATIAWLIGAALSLRFKVFVLVPAISVMLVFVAVAEVTRGETIWWTSAAMLSVAVSAQLGYFGTGILLFIVEEWSHRQSQSPGISGHAERSWWYF